MNHHLVSDGCLDGDEFTFFEFGFPIQLLIRYVLRKGILFIIFFNKRLFSLRSHLSLVFAGVKQVKNHR